MVCQELQRAPAAFAECRPMSEAAGNHAGPALKIYSSVLSIGPMLVHAVGDMRSAPLIEPGEVVIVDPNDCLPTNGGFFLIEFSSGPRHRRRAVMEAFQHPSGDLNSYDCWYLGHHARHWNRWLPVDGPKPMHQIMEMILGRVVGIYRLGASA